MSTAVLFKVVFGEPLKEAMRKGEGWKIPILIHKATDYIKSKVTVSSGIFKVVASKWKVQKLKEEFERGAVGLSKYNDPHSVAALLVLYLTTLPDSLLSPQIQLSIREAYRTKTGDDFIELLKTTMHKSALPNKLLLKYLFLFLHNVLSHFNTNKVDAPTLALAWAPVFFPSSSSSPPPDGSTQPTNTKEDVKMTEILIDNYTAIWENGDKKGNGVKADPSQPHPPRSPLPSHSQLPSTTTTSTPASKALGVTTNGTEAKRTPSPGGARPARPSSALSSSSAAKGSPARGHTPPLSKTSTKPTTPSKLTKQLTAPTFKKKTQSPTPTPIRSKSPALPRNNHTKARSNQPHSQLAGKKKNLPNPPSSTLEPPLLPHKQLSTLSPSPSQPQQQQQQQQHQQDTLNSPAVSSLALMRSESQVLHGLVDTELHSSDFRASDDVSVSAGASSMLASVIGESEIDNESIYDNENDEDEDSGDEPREEVKVEGRSSLIYQENDILFNNRLSGSFVSIPKLKLEKVLPYDFQTAAKKKASKASKTKTAPTANSKSNIKKNPVSNLFSKVNNKSLSVPKLEYNARSPSPVPKPRPHSSHTLSRSSFATSSPTTPLRSHHSPHPPSSAPSRALKLIAEDSEREKKKGDKKPKDKEREKGNEELLARNKELESEILVLRARVKDDEEKLANEEKNVSFLLSRVEILDKQRMEAVNKIIDEKSHAEKELRVRLSTLEAEVLVQREQLKMTENSASMKNHNLSQHSIELEARVTLLQAQLDRAYEEIAEKDIKLSSLNPNTLKENGDVKYIDTPKPPITSENFYYHHPFAQSDASNSNELHSKNNKKYAWKANVEEFGDVSL